MTLEEDALRIAIEPAATAWFESEKDELDPASEWHDYLRDISCPDRPVALLVIPAVRALLEASMLVDIEALKALHRPIGGYRFCPHESDDVECPAAGPCVDYYYKTAMGGITIRRVLPVTVCAECIVGNAGSDLPYWVDDKQIGYVDHPVPGQSWPDDMSHQLWPCNTAVALGLT